MASKADIPTGVQNTPERFEMTAEGYAKGMRECSKCVGQSHWRTMLGTK